MQQGRCVVRRLWLSRVAVLTTQLSVAPAELVKTEAPASSQSNVSTQVMTPGFVFNILLVSANSGLEAEIVEAWQADGKESGDPCDNALVHYSFERAHDVLVVLDLLDRIRLGFFTQFLSFLQLHRSQGPDTPMSQVSSR